MASRAWPYTLAAALALSPTAIAAQPAEPTPTLQEKETARALLDKGRALEKKGDLAGAIESFRGAHSIMGLPTTGIFLARALTKAGQLIEARDIALAASRAPKLPNERPERIAARNDAAKLVVELGPRIPSLTIRPSPEDAAGLVVLVGDQPIPASVVGLPWAVDPGEHTVTARADRFEEQSRIVRVAEGAEERLTFDLVALRAEPTDSSPPPAVPPSPAPRAADEGMAPAWIVAAIGLSVGGASLVAGGVLGGISLSRTQDIQAQCNGTSCPTSLRGDADRAQTLATAANVTLIAGGVLALVGAVAAGMGLEAETSPSEAAWLLGPAFVGWKGSF